MFSFKYRLVIFPVVIIIVTLLPALLIYFLGYKPNTAWNENAVKTTCTVVDHKTKDQMCSCGENCSFICYSGWVEVNYTDNHHVDHEEWTKAFEPQLEEKSSVEYVNNWLDDHYPIGKNTKCYYNSEDTSSVRLKMYDASSYFIGFIILGAFGMICLVAWMVLEYAFSDLSIKKCNQHCCL